MPTPPSDPSVNLELRDYLGILRRRKALIALLTAIPVVVTLVVSLLATPRFKAQGSLIIQSNDLEAVIAGTGSSTNATPEQVMKERQIMGSTPTKNAIRARLDYLPEVKISPPEDNTTIIGVAATSSSKGSAAKSVNDYLDSYVAVRTATLKAQVEQAIADTKEDMTKIDIEVALARQRLDQIAVELAAEPPAAQRLLLEAERDRVAGEVSAQSVATRQAELQGRLAGLNQAKASYDTRSSYTVSEAFPPKRPVSPRPIRNSLLALGFGLLFALVVAFFRDYFDDTFRTKEDVDAFTGHIPILGIVPAITEWRDRKTALLESVSHPSSAAAEAYRSLRTGLEFLGIDRKIRIVHVTSSASGEGKSTTSANLAVSLARAGKHVVLVDCDLRRPRMHEFFGMDNSVGLTSLILGTASIEEALVPAPGIPGLMILASGPTPPNPSELLSTKTAQSKLEALSRSADYVVVDSPPLLPVSDSVILARYADATLLVVTARSTTRRALGRSLELLDQVDAPLEGIVFNGVSIEATYGYGYGYGYAYGYGGSSSSSSANGPRSGGPSAPAGPSVPVPAPEEASPAARTTNGAAPVSPQPVRREPARPKTI